MTDAPASGKRDYKATLFLPQTNFAMKAGLPAAEPKWLKRWEDMKLYARLREQSAGRTRFLLHDGPPYANANIHVGTATNKILKDFVVRSQQMMGKDAPYVPGWDCHGLPIEWKIEEKYRSEGKDKDKVPVAEFRKECRDYAAHWLEVQREEFKRLGCTGDWARPYLTMDYRAEAAIAGELMKFAARGLLYRGSKPVMWSVVEKTALAEAEVEYHEKLSPTIYVRFPVLKGPDALKGASVVIWTTTPWTIPGNRAIAYSDDIEYGIYEITQAGAESFARAGERLLLADSLAEGVKAAAKVEEWKRLGHVLAKGIVCAHPLRGQGYEFEVPLLAGEHVTSDTGTGFVHTAPGHGADDFELWMKHPEWHPKQGPAIPFTVAEDGSFYPDVPLFAGKKILTAEGKEGDANGAVIKALTEAGALLAKGKLRHDYPHSWRSKAPLIFRNTPQWFIALDKPITAEGGKTLRALSLEAISKTKWTPAQAENRIRAMVAERPDWVISRQRAWGVPITVFVEKKSGKLLVDEAVNARILEAFEKEGADAWFDSPASRFLGNERNPEDYEKASDILDVWFDSGSTHAFTVENPIDPHWPKADHADLYLEGSDQHRGWFQSSLLEGCGTRGRAPYDAVMTHGFVLDEHGRKMSKSLGNVVAPQQVADQHGAEILRLWASSSDYFNDLLLGPKILQEKVEAYRKLRNTIRFVLANLSGFEESERIAPAGMPELDGLILHRLAELDRIVRAGYEAFDFTTVFTALMAFASGDLSAFYFDIRKDALYCDAKASVRRRAARTVLDEIFSCLTAWLAPILCFTMEEAWLERFPGEKESVHLRVFPEVPASWRDEALAKRWARIRELRRVVTGALELKRRDKTIGASLEAAPILYVESRDDAALFDNVNLAEICITSAAALKPGKAPADSFTLDEVKGAACAFAKADGHKCERCWMVLPEVGANAAQPDLCKRCIGAVEARG